MNFIFTCPFCNQELDCDDSLIGVTVNCPKCGKEIVPVREKNVKKTITDMPTDIQPHATNTAPEATIQTVCPHCLSCFEVDKKWLNQRTECPSCGMFFVISSEEKPILKPIANPNTTPTIFDKQKKDILFFWITFPIFYFLLLTILASPSARSANGSIPAVVMCFIFLAIGTRSVIMAETRMKTKLLALYMTLLFLVFPIGFIMYAEERKQSGLSNIMPWAIIASIVNGLTLIITIWFMFNVK